MWVVIGVSGVTCGGKTSLARGVCEQHERLGEKKFGEIRTLSQDDYFLPEDSEAHVLVPGLNHINFDVITSLDMRKMVLDVHKILSEPPSNGAGLLILEGFNLLYCKPLLEVCDLIYFFILTKAECKRRRELRVYEPPDCEGYFEQCVWPEYLKYLEFVQENCGHIRYIDSSPPALPGGPAEGGSIIPNDVANAFRWTVIKKVFSDVDELLAG